MQNLIYEYATKVFSSIEKVNHETPVDNIIIWDQDNVTDERWNEYQQKHNDYVNEVFKEVDWSNLKEASKSKSGKFTLWCLPKETKPGSWSYTMGVIKSSDTNEIIAKIYRNYSIFHHSWCLKDQDEYLITAEDYQGLTVVNCTQGWVKSWVPKSAAKGAGFCFHSADTSPDERYLSILGCIWGGPYQYMIRDFSHPESLPYPTLKIIDDIDEYESNNEWTPNSYQMKVNLERPKYLLTGKLFYCREQYVNHKNMKLEEPDEKWKNLSLDERNEYQMKADQENLETQMHWIDCLKDYLEDADDFNYDPETHILKIIYKLD